MPAFTGTQLINRAKTLADMRDNFVTPEEFVDWINYEVPALDVFTARAGWITSATTVETFSPPSSLFSLAGTPLAIIGVYEYDQGNYRRIPLSNVVDLQRDDAAETGVPQYYTAQYDGDVLNIRLHPRTTVHTIKVVYLQAKAPIAVPADSVGAWPLGFEERIVLRLAIKALTKEESDTGAVERLLTTCEQDISATCWSRALGETGKVRNVDITERSWTPYPVFPGSDSWAWV